MNRRYHYIAETYAGTKAEFQIEENDQSVADVQAKIEVERWLADEGETPADLLRFDYVFREPA